MNTSILTIEEMGFIEGGGFWSSVSDGVSVSCGVWGTANLFAPVLSANPVGLTASAFCAGWGLAAGVTSVLGIGSE